MTENKRNNKSYYCEGEERILRGQIGSVMRRKRDYVLVRNGPLRIWADVLQ